MSKYIVRRLLVAVPLVLAIVTVVFVMLRVAIPGDPVYAIVGDTASQELIDQTRKNLGLDRSIFEQYLIFLANMVRGDLGRSIKQHQPVTQEILQAFPYTAALTFQSVAVGTLVGLLVGVVSAVKRGTWLDHISMVGVVIFNAIPTFWLSLILILIFAVRLRWLPVEGSGTWRHFVLPVLTLSAGEAALIARLTRSNLLEVLGSDYIRTARSKGLAERTVILRHALQNTLIPIITVVGLSVGGLLGGAVITETVFGLPGVGSLTIQAVGFRDYPVIQGTVLLVAAVFVIVNLIVDIIYAYVDPRIHYE